MYENPEFFEEVEQLNTTEHLINYRFYQANIKALEEAIKIDRLTSDGLRATDYSRDNISTSGISNITENTAIHILTKENDLKKQRLLVDSIDRAIKELEDIDKQREQLLEEKKIIDKMLETVDNHIIRLNDF